MERKLVMLKLKFLLPFFIVTLCPDFSSASMATRMRRTRPVSVVVTLSWTTNPSTWNFTDGQNTYTLTNTGANAATGLSFSLPVYAGVGSPIPGNLGDPPPAGDYLYILTHNCGSTLAVAASCSVTIKAAPFISNPVYTSCSATSGVNVFTLTNLFYDTNI